MTPRKCCVPKPCGAQHSFYDRSRSQVCALPPPTVRHLVWPTSQERLGLELTSLIEDPQSASVRMIATEAHAIVASGTAVGPSLPSESWSTWIAPSPVSVKLRLFCLPYAGGVSENVFARYDRPPVRSLTIHVHEVV